jgi:phosphotransferase system  glucose/maltose/N-acetylglucosamine-specific IIC component
MNWKAFANGFSTGLFIIVLVNNWDNIFVIRTMAVGVVVLYGILMYGYIKRVEEKQTLTKKEKIEKKYSGSLRGD